MNAETFCEHFATFAAAPNGVDKLRAMILQLAVQGKLVPQDENDEPASSLRKRLAVQADELLRAGRTTRPKELPAVKPSEVPFHLPHDWEWVRFGELAAEVEYGTSQKASEIGGDVPVLRMNAIRNGKVILEESKFVSSAIDDLPRLYLKNGDILFNRTNSFELVGKSGVFIGQDDKFTFASYLIRGSLLPELSSDFVVLAMNASYFRKTQIEPELTQQCGQANFNGTKLRNSLIPLPPLAEQRRIVVKVNQLLGLCDELAARQAAQREKRQRLVGATLDRLVSTRNPAEFLTHAHRLRNHFDQLFDTPTTIPQLRQTILQLAVLGKLVQQNPDDEPASELLGRVRVERRELWEKAVLAKFTASSTIPKDSGWKEKYEPATMLERDDHFEIPLTWKWLSFDEIVPQFQYGPRFGVDEYVPDGIPTVRTTDMDYRGRVELGDAPRVRVPPQAEGHWCLQSGDALVTRTGATIGKCALYDDSWGKAIASAYLIRFRLTQQTVYPPFVLLMLMSPFGQGLLLTGATETAQPNVNATNISRFPFPLAPLVEQKRIVTKVTELLSLCDALEAKLTRANSASTQLLSAAVHHLLQESSREGAKPRREQP